MNRNWLDELKNMVWLITFFFAAMFILSISELHYAIFFFGLLTVSLWIIYKALEQQKHRIEEFEKKTEQPTKTESTGE